MANHICGKTSAPLLSSETVAAGNFFPKLDRSLYTIPATPNVFLSISQLCAAFVIPTFCSHRSNILVHGCLAVLFAFVMQMGFYAAHEAVHRKLHPDRDVNLGLGVVMFAVFPGSFLFFEVAHLIPHRRNRSDDELEDYVLPSESAWSKRLMYYLLYLRIVFAAYAFVFDRRRACPQKKN